MHDFDTDGHRARKRFGQNFLSDPNIIRKIIDAHPPAAGRADGRDRPRPGRDDRAADRASRPPARGRDRPRPDRPPARALHAGAADGPRGRRAEVRLRQPLAARRRGPRLRIVGNLPYNISTPILFHLAGFADQVKDMTFMLQKEVVMRMVAEPGTEEYGRLSVMLQYRFRMGRLFDVPPGAFRPAPKVMSSIVRMAPLVGGTAGAATRLARAHRRRRLRPAPQDPAQHPARVHRRHGCRRWGPRAAWREAVGGAVRRDRECVRADRGEAPSREARKKAGGRAGFFVGWGVLTSCRAGRCSCPAGCRPGTSRAAPVASGTMPIQAHTGPPNTAQASSAIPATMRRILSAPPTFVFMCVLLGSMG
jgi:16S rRNA (adenine1518-N6/adenine1519-N6)-dimethyltransferase